MTGAVVVAKRKLEIAGNTPPARIQDAAKMPVVKCLLSKALHTVARFGRLGEAMRGIDGNEDEDDDDDALDSKLVSADS